MAVTNGKLEALITIPAGDWTVSLTESTPVITPATVTLTAAKTYYWSSAGNDTVSFAARLQERLGAASPNTRTYTVTVGAGEDGTGLLTIAVSAGTFTLTSWNDAAIWALLGHSSTTAFAAAAASTVGDEHVQCLWLPDGPHVTPWGAQVPRRETDARSMTSPAGHTKVLYGQRRAVHSIEWPQVTRAKTHVIAETTTGASFEQFWLDAILADLSCRASPGGPLRLHWDAGSATYATVMVAGEELKAFAPEQVQTHWTGLYRFALPRLVEVP